MLCKVTRNIMENKQLRVGDLVQIDPDYNEMFGGKIMIVTEPKAFGAQGYFADLKKDRAFFRCDFENMEWVGHCEWIMVDDSE